MQGREETVFLSKYSRDSKAHPNKLQFSAQEAAGASNADDSYSTISHSKTHTYLKKTEGKAGEIPPVLNYTTQLKLLTAQPIPMPKEQADGCMYVLSANSIGRKGLHINTSNTKERKQDKNKTRNARISEELNIQNFGSTV